MDDPLRGHETARTAPGTPDLPDTTPDAATGHGGRLTAAAHHARPAGTVAPQVALRNAVRRAHAALWDREDKLAAELTAVLNQAGRVAAHNFRKHTVSLAASAFANVEPTSTMVCVYPAPDEQKTLAQPGGEPAELLHVTLAYLGDTTPDEAATAAQITEQIAAKSQPLQGTIAGVATFCEGADGYPSLAIPSVDGLAELAVAVRAALAGAGLNVHTNWGWVPHITIAYENAADPPPTSLLEQPVTFNDLCVTRGDIPVMFPLGEGAITASADWTQPHADELVDVSALAARLHTKSDPIRRSAIEEYGHELRAAADQAGIDVNWDLTNPLVGRAVAGAARHVTNIADTTRLNVMRSIGTAYDQGLSIPDTAKLIQAGMEAASPARGRLIARTELAAVANGGSLAMAQTVAGATGDTYYKRWMTAPGAHYPRHELADEYPGLDGQTVPLDDTFEVGDAQLQYPGDPNGPPEEVCNCRCALIYVTAVDEQVPASQTPEMVNVNIMEPPAGRSWDGFPFDVRSGQGPTEADTAPERTRDGDFILYHGTSQAGAEAIRREGIRPDDLGVVGVTTTPGAAQAFAAMKGGGVVLRVVMDKTWLADQNVRREVGGPGHDQFLIRPKLAADRMSGTWEGVPADALKDVREHDFEASARASDPSTTLPESVSVTASDRMGMRSLNEVYRVRALGNDVIVKPDPNSTRARKRFLENEGFVTHALTPGEAEFWPSSDLAVRQTIPFGKDLERERAAYVTAQVFNEVDPARFHVDVPGFRIGEVTLDNGTVERAGISQYVKDSTPAVHLDWKSELQAAPDNEIRSAALYDSIIGNTDRHPGNWLYDGNGKMWLIDHGLAFPDKDGGEWANRQLVKAALRRFGRDLTGHELAFLEGLRARWAELDAQLAPLLPQEERDLMRERIEYLIDSGERVTPGDTPDPFA